MNQMQIKKEYKNMEIACCEKVSKLKLRICLLLLSHNLLLKKICSTFLFAKKGI